MATNALRRREPTAFPSIPLHDDRHEADDFAFFAWAVDLAELVALAIDDYATAAAIRQRGERALMALRDWR